MSFVKTSELQGAALNWAVAKAEGKHLVKLHDHFSKLARHSGISEERLAQQPDVWVWLDSVGATQPLESYCEAWAQGGPIIEREGIELLCNLTATETARFSAPGVKADWQAFHRSDRRTEARQFAPTPLNAAMRCYVASKLGDEVDIPEELI
jgi:hypothetical protein